MKFWKENKVLWILIGAYILIFGFLTAMKHYNFQTQTWDLGIFDQTFWNTIHGRIMQNNIEEVRNHLGVHMSPFLFLLVPGYALFPSPYFLLLIQTIALGLGAWPLYLLAKRILNQERWAMLLTIGYLVYPALHWVNFFDFHEISFLIPLLLAAFYFLEIGKFWWSGIFLALAASTKEDAILVVLFVGIYLLLKRNPISKENPPATWWTTQKKFGLGIILISLIYFFLTIHYLMPALGGGLLRIDRYAHLGHTPQEIIINIVTQPSLFLKTIFQSAKIEYLIWLFLPVAFLPLFSGSALLLLIPGLLENLLTNFQSQFTGFYQYDAALIAGIFIASLYGLRKILGRWNPKYVYWSLLTTLIIGYLVRSPINPIFFPTEILENTPQWDAYRQMLELVPPDVTVAAQTNLVPHLSHREQIYMLGAEPVLMDAVLIDTADPFGFRTDEQFNQYTENYLRSGNYNVQVIDKNYLVFLKKTLSLPYGKNS